MNDIFLQNALRMIESLTPDQLAADMAAYGLEFTRQFVYFDDLTNEMKQEVTTGMIINCVVGSAVTVGDGDFKVHSTPMNTEGFFAVNDNYYALAA